MDKSSTESQCADALIPSVLACGSVLLADGADVVRREEEDLATFCYCYRSAVYETGFAK